MNQEDHYLKCPSCGLQSGVDPALLFPDSPMPYCKKCDNPLMTIPLIKKQQPERKEENDIIKGVIDEWKLNGYEGVKSKFRIERIK